MWLVCWPGLLLLLVAVGIVVALGVLVSPWLLLILGTGLPPYNNLPRFVGGFIQALDPRLLPMTVALDGSRLGYATALDAEESSMEWVSLEDIVRVERIADLIVVLGPGGLGIAIPADRLETWSIELLRSKAKEQPKSNERARPPSA